jgi:hypothetical protein
MALGHIKALPTKEVAEATTKTLLPRGSNRSTANTAGVETVDTALLAHLVKTLRHRIETAKILLWTRVAGIRNHRLLTAKAATKTLLLGHLVKALTTKATTKAALLLLTAEAASHW